MKRIAVGLYVAATVALMFWGYYQAIYVAPTDAMQGEIFRIIFYHVPLFICTFLFFAISFLGSIGFLAYRHSRPEWAQVADAWALAGAEVGVVCCTNALILGSMWGRRAWGIWWTWDARLTSMLACWLIYAGYVMLRRAVDEPTQRARLSAFLSIFGCVDAAFVYKSIEWFRTQHPSPVLSVRSGGGMGPGMEAPIYWNWLAFMCLAAVLVMVRMRQEEASREIDSLRRMAHSY